ncbi:MAG TPA: MFS transporter [Acidimicrobiales bacterium]|nr:MFS transporter [Acidimicrobiales bacterium]
MTGVPSLPADLDPLEKDLLSAVVALEREHSPRGAPGPLPDGLDLEALFDDQCSARHLDHVARRLKERGFGYYTISSAGHESNAVVASVLRCGDPALLHYRSGGFYAARARACGRSGWERDVLLGMLAAREEPMAGGRHKVFGHPDMAVIPQTSTIASHLPRAMGTAFAVDRAARLGRDTPWGPRAVAVCSFGDASFNHSTTQGALNAALLTSHRGLPMPLLFLCEDNGIGISVPTPPDWIETAVADRPGLTYARAEGHDPVGVHTVARDLVERIRDTRRPGFLHLRTVRFLGHAGSDVEAAYRSAADIRADRERDPILGTARAMVTHGLATPAELVERYLRGRRHITELAESLLDAPQMNSAVEVMAPLAGPEPMAVAQQVEQAAPTSDRTSLFGTPPEDQGPLTLAETLNRTLADTLAADPGALVFGEDVGLKGGVYGVTRKLQRMFGASRVFDTILDEQSILGLALGTAVCGLLPIPEIQYLAYLHNAIDQIRGEAATLAFFSQRRYLNPMVVRIASYGYQKGFGGHFHNDNGLAPLLDIPGVVIASPGRPADAAAMLRTCVAAARAEGTVSLFLEPIALYHTRDLLTPGDGRWLAPYRPPAAWAADHVPIGRARVARPGRDLVIMTWANGLYMSLRVAERLAAEGIDCRVLDLRWLAPLPVEQIRAHAEGTGRVLIVDETRRSGGVGEGVVTALVEGGYRGPAVLVAGEDSFVPLGEAAATVLVSEARIEAAVRSLVAR